MGVFLRYNPTNDPNLVTPIFSVQNNPGFQLGDLKQFLINKKSEDEESPAKDMWKQAWKTLKRSLFYEGLKLVKEQIKKSAVYLSNLGYDISFISYNDGSKGLSIPRVPHIVVVGTAKDINNNQIQILADTKMLTCSVQTDPIDVSDNVETLNGPIEEVYPQLIDSLTGHLLELESSQSQELAESLMELSAIESQTRQLLEGSELEGSESEGSGEVGENQKETFNKLKEVLEQQTGTMAKFGEMSKQQLFAKGLLDMLDVKR